MGSRLAPLAALALLLAPPVLARPLPSGTASSGDALTTLLAGKPHGSWTKLSASTDGNFAAAQLPATMVNFDGLATNGTGTWASDAAVAGAPMGGVQSDGPWSFSKAAVNASSGYTIFWGGGHQDSGDGSIYGFDPVAAAASLNLSGPGGSWTLLVPSGRYLDAFTQTEPAWSHQTPGTTPTGKNQSYWVTTNKGGVEMPISSHSYNFNQWIPGTTKFALGGTFGFDAAGDPRIGAAFIYDTSAGMQSPLYLAPGSAGLVGTEYGYAGKDTSNIAPTFLAWDSNNGQPYTEATNSGGSFSLVTFTSPTTASLAETQLPNPTADTLPDIDFAAVIFPQPGASGKMMLFEDIGQASASGAVANTFLVWTDIEGSPAESQHTYAATFPAHISAVDPGWTYDSKRGVLLASFGDQHLYEVPPNSTLTNWVPSEFTSSPTGATPTCSGASDGGYPTLTYLPNYDADLLICTKQVWVYKP